MAEATTRAAAARWRRPTTVFYGWWIVFAGGGLQMLVASLMGQAYGAYVVLLRDDFGWSKTALAAGSSLREAESGILGPIHGFMLDRFGPRAVSRTGVIILGAGFLLLIPALVFLARALGRRTESGRWAAQTGLMCGIAYVGVNFAVGFPAGAAAMYGAQHGLDVEAAFSLNNLRIFAYFLSLMLLGGSTMGIALSAVSDGIHRRWVGGFGAVTGLALLASTPLSAVGLQDWGTLVWMIWFTGVGVLLLRHQEPAGPEARTSVPTDVGVGHP